MSTQEFATYEEMCVRVGDEIRTELVKNPEMMLCIAAGHTSLGVFRVLRELYQQGRADFSKASFVAMDEWKGMSAQTPDSCGAMLQEEFLDQVPFGKVRLFDGTVSDLQAECESVEMFIKKESKYGVMDYLVLGSGMNGHLGLNEPGSPFDSRARVTQLDDVTLQVGQKYFDETTELIGGVTLGIGNFKEARRTVLMVNGKHKSGILRRILEEPINPSLPATAVRSFENAAVYYDSSAKTGLESV